MKQPQSNRKSTTRNNKSVEFEVIDTNDEAIAVVRLSKTIP